MFHRSKSYKHTNSVGGFAFFLSLACLLFLSVLNMIHLPALWDSTAASNLLQFGMGIVIGCGAAMTLVFGHASVFLHEVKHSILSNLVGNRAKGMRIRRSHGHFKYEYTQATAEYNAFISLAPYFFPLFTFPSILIAIAAAHGQHSVQVLICGVGAGLDYVLNIRDIGPHQTDFTSITGGYSVGLFYVFIMNVTIATFLLAWVMQGVFGLKYLIYGLYIAVVHIVAVYRSR